jgi:hypothetical protein
VVFALESEVGAHALCQKLLSFAGPLLLYAEEIDTATGEHLGNFPQAFTHLTLIEARVAAHRLRAPGRAALWRPAGRPTVTHPAGPLLGLGPAI